MTGFGSEDDDVRTPPPASRRSADGHDSPSNSSAASVQRQTPPFAVAAVPPNIRILEYAVRGKVLDRAFELEKDMLTHHYNFDRLLRCHLGNPHAVGAPALTYIREVVSLLLCPALFESRAEPALLQVYKSDSLARARNYRKAMGEPGAYTHSQGAKCLREEVASFFEKRDGFRPDADTIFLTNGASDAISTVLSVIIGGPSDGMLLPRPQYPLYSATMCRLNGHAEFYDLDESLGWRCTVAAIDKAWHRASAAGIDVKGIVIINPGNPAPTVLEREDVEQILEYALHRNMAVLADEVYQENLYKFELHEQEKEARDLTRPELEMTSAELLEASAADNRLTVLSPPPMATAAAADKFVPFRKVLLEKGLATQLVSLHSSSKGFYGECGFRGGLMQIENLNRPSLMMMYKMRSVELCSNTIGQVCMALVSTPPKPGEPSYQQYTAEKTAALNDLAEKARMTTEFFNSLEGVSCQPIKGALYAFPRIEFPPHAFAAAAARGISIDLMYSLDLLNQTGIVTVPGDAFGQVEGTHHIRLTILPRTADLKKAFAQYRQFHENFMRPSAAAAAAPQSGEVVLCTSSPAPLSSKK